MDLQFCFVAENRKGRHVPIHTHPALELVYYTAGSGSTVIGRKNHRVRRHHLAVIPAGVPHDQKNFTDLVSICVGVSQSSLEPLQGLWTDSGGIIGRQMELLVKELKNRESGYELITRGMLLEIEGLIQRLAHETVRPPRREALVRKALDIIHRHDGALSVADIANRLYVSKDYLRHLFTEYAGQSPIKFLLGARIEKARKLLENDLLLIGDIAQECGFDDIYYFSRFFRKVTGQTPSHYRKKHHARRPSRKPPRPN